MKTNQPENVLHSLTIFYSLVQDLSVQIYVRLQQFLP